MKNLIALLVFAVVSLPYRALAAPSTYPINFSHGCAFNLVANACVPTTSGGVVNWGTLVGTLSNQVDLQAALNAKQNSLGFTPLNAASNLSDIVSAATARTNLGLGTAAVASAASFEPAVVAGTNLQYYRGDKSFQTLDTLAVPENTNLYFTTARARASVSATAPIVDTAGVFSMHVADATDDGYLSLGDWGVFNGKQNALGFTPENVANKSTDGTLSANSDTLYASQKAAKTYVDAGLASKQNTLTFTSPIINTAGTVAWNGAIDTGKFSLADPSDATKLWKWDLSTESTGVTTTLRTLETANIALQFQPNVDATANILTQNATSGQVFIGNNTTIGGSNSGIQYSDASTANRGQIKLHSYFNGTSVAGVSTLTSRSGTVAVNNAVVAGQDYSKWTAQAGATTAGSAPISGTFAFKANTVNALTVTSDYHLALTNLAGTLADRFFLSSEGVPTFSGLALGVVHSSAGGLFSSSAVTSADIDATVQPALSTSAAPANQFANGFTAPNTFTYAQPAFTNISGIAAAAQLPALVADTVVAAGTQGAVPAPIANTTEGGKFLTGNGFALVDQSKPRPDPFTLYNQTADGGASVKYEDLALVTLNGVSYAVVSCGNPSPTLTIWNISNPSKPIKKGSLNLSGSYRIVTTVIGGVPYAVVPSSGSSTLYVVNISDPTAPVVQGSIPLTGSPGALYNVVVSNGYAFIATQSKGLNVVDIGNGGLGGTPSAPVQGFQEGAVKSFGIAISGTTLYTTVYTAGSAPFANRFFKTWDISTPTAPSLTQTFTFPNTGTKPNGITLSGTNAFVTDTNLGLIQILDITTPALPTLTTSMAPTGTFNSGFTAQISGNYAYIPSGLNATDGGYIDLYDITTIATPVKVSTVKTGVGTSVFGGIALANGYIYAADYGVAPGASGFDVFTRPVEGQVAGNVIASTFNAKTSYNYPASTPANWSPTPTTVWSALDQLSARVPVSGPVASVSASAPLISSGGTTPNITITQAATGASGFLSSTDWNAFNNKEPAIAAGTTAQYWRGDKSFQTLDTLSVPENTNLYYTQARFDTAFAAKSTTNLAEGTNLYFTNARAQGAVSATAPIVDTAGVFSMPVSTNAVDGFLSGADHTTFAAKQSAISTSSAVANQFVTGFTAPNTFTRAQPAFTDLTGSATIAQLPDMSVVAKVANYTLTASDRIVTVCGTFTITLPAATTVLKLPYTIKSICAGTITIAPTGGDNVEFGASISLTSQGQSVDLFDDLSTNWYTK